MQTDIATAAEIYSNRAIEQLKVALARLQSFSTNFTDEFKAIGDSISIPVITADDFAAWNDASNNFNRAAGTPQEKKLNLGTKLIGGFAITPAQIRRFRPAFWNGKADLNVNSLAGQLLSLVAAIITAENYGDEKEDKMAVPLAKFGLMSISDIRAAIVDRNMVPEASSLCLNPIYYSRILKDCGYDKTGDPAILLTGRIPGLMGFKEVVEIKQLGTAPGFVSHPDAICVGTAIEDLPSTSGYDLVQVITEPETGFTMQQVIMTELSTGKQSSSVNALPAVGVGNSKALMRLVA